MAGYRIPGPIGTNPGAKTNSVDACRAGFAPGPVESNHELPASRVLPSRRRTAPGPKAVGRRFSTDSTLLSAANTVALRPKRDRAVFYAEDRGMELAAAFVAANPGYARLDELLAETEEGRQLWDTLMVSGRPWSDKEEVWWELSRRLARVASGIVHAFGPDRLTQPRPLEEFKHKYQVQTESGMRNAYANTVFEKVEWPELEQNYNVTEVYYNGELFGED